jgi:hypothetical protein
MTDHEYTAYLEHDIAVWGEDYIFDLLDRGYQLHQTNQGIKWILPLTKDSTPATVESIRLRRFSPVST